MEIRLSVLRKERFILVHWFMDLKNANENLSFNEKKKEKNQENIKNRIISFMPFATNSFMIVRFDISNKKLYLNEYETFKYKYPEESQYMGSKENLNQYVRDYFTEENVQIMLKTIIASDRTRLVDKDEIAKYLIKNDKQNTRNKKEENKKTTYDYYRYDLVEEDNVLLEEQLKSAIAQLHAMNDTLSLDKVKQLENILNNVKHINITNKKINATEKARTINKENSRNKIEKACKSLLASNTKITVYSIAKRAKISYPTAKKYKEIYEKYIVNND